MWRSLFVGLLFCGWAQCFAGPKIEHWVTPTGARVFYVEAHHLPMIDVQIDFEAGSALDPVDKAGLAALTHGLLDLGTNRLSELEIADALADIGATLSGGVSDDRASIHLRTLSEPAKQRQAIELLHQVLTQPSFPQKVLERERGQSVSMLKDALTRPGVIAQRAFWQSAYSGHPYGRQVSLNSLTSLTREDVKAFYERHYQASRVAITIVGDISRSEAAEMALLLSGGLPQPAGERVEIPAAVASGAKEIKIPNSSTQAHLLIGAPAIKRGDPDFFPLLVGNYILGGGGFSSRLMHEVREKRGMAYGVSSSFQPLSKGGPFVIGLQTKKNQADAALQLCLSVLGDFLAKGPTPSEVAAAKRFLAGSFPLRLDSNSKLVDNVALIGFYGLPLNYLDEYTQNVEKVTPEAIRAAFARHVAASQLVTVVVGGLDTSASSAQ